MADAAGKNLKACMYCSELLPQKDLNCHFNECRFKEVNKLPESGSIAFGAKSATSNVFGHSTFGVCTPNTGSLFGNSSRLTGFGHFGQTFSFSSAAPALTSTGTIGFATTTLTGTTLKFCPPTGTDTMMKGGVSTSIAIRLQCITSMKEYENKSLEELRVEDYAANRKGRTTRGIKFGGGTQRTGGLFGSTAAASTAGFSFGNTTQSKPLFGTTGTTRNKFVSYAIQTDISAIDTKDTKDQDLPSFHTKDVTLLTESMKELFIKGSDHDVKITVKDKQFQAHRLILKTRSPVFAMMLNHDSQESITGTIKIEDCDPDSFDEFLLYLYSGRTENLTPTKALHLYYTADKYDVPGLKERCAIFLKTSLSVESICDVILLAKRCDEKELLEEATKFFAQNLREILVTVHWQKFLSENPIEGNELYIKSIDFFPRK